MKKVGKRSKLSRAQRAAVWVAILAGMCASGLAGAYLMTIPIPSPHVQCKRAAEQVVARRISDPQQERLKVIRHMLTDGLGGRPLSWYQCRPDDERGFVVVAVLPNSNQRHYYRVCCHATQSQADDIQPDCAIID